MTKLFIRIEFEPSGAALSPGMIQLLEAVKKEGSIRRAAKSLDISYRKAWLLIQQMRMTFNGPAVLAEAGGHSGGGTGLTELGLALLHHYRSAETRVLIEARDDINALSKLVRPDAPSRRHER